MPRFKHVQLPNFFLNDKQEKVNSIKNFINSNFLHYLMAS